MILFHHSVVKTTDDFAALELVILTPVAVVACFAPIVEMQSKSVDLNEYHLYTGVN